MKNRLSLLVLIVIASLFGARVAIGQETFHIPLKGIEVKLRSLSVKDTLDTTISKSIPFELNTATDEDGKFMFGYVPPGTYALGCSYSACNNAFRKSQTKEVSGASPDAENNSSEDPTIRISVDACEGMVCKIAVANVTPDDWSDSEPSATTTIARNWSNRTSWLKNGGGVTLRVDGASSTISGKIEVQ